MRIQPRRISGRVLQPGELLRNTRQLAPPIDYTSLVTDEEGASLTDPQACGFTLAGYAIPLLDPDANHAQEGDCFAGDWTPWIGWHVATASTCTILLNGSGTWRMYMPEPRLAKESFDVASVNDFPFSHPAEPTITRDPDNARWSESTPRFSSDYIAFVDSADGVQFPVYAPVGTYTILPNGACFGWKDEEFAEPDWTNAGWTPTCIPSRTVADNPAGVHLDNPLLVVYSIYRDPSVVYVPSQGVYLMFAVECRRTDPHDGMTDACTKDGVYPIPFTRFVVFVSESPDFQAEGTTPDPRDASALAVLVQPDVGADGPRGGSTPNEWYGVPSVVMSPDGTQVLIFLTWDGDTLSSPSRVFDRYGASNPPWTEMPARSGVSVFAIDPDALVAAAAAGDTAGLQALIAAGYQGEALFTDRMQWSDGSARILEGIDHQLVVCQGQLWVYYAAKDGCRYKPTTDGEQCGAPATQLARLQHVPLDELPSSLRATLTGTGQGEFTVFLRPTSCGTLFDLQSILPSTQGSTRDPDVAVLPDGRIRVAMSYEGAPDADGFIDQGLIQVIADNPALCEPEVFETPRFFDECHFLCSENTPLSRFLCALCQDELQIQRGVDPVGPIDKPRSFPDYEVGADNIAWQETYVTARGAKVFIW